MGSPCLDDRQDMLNKTNGDAKKTSYPPRKPLTGFKAWLLSLGLSLTAAITVGSIFRVEHAKPRPDLLVDIEAAERALIKEDVVDAILGLVSTYYVDSDRASHTALLTSLADGITTHTAARAWVEDSTFYISPAKGASFSRQVENSLLGFRSLFEQVEEYLEKENLALHSADNTTPLRFNLLNSLLAELDPHSSLLSPQDYRELKQGTEGSFGGLGILVGIRDHILTVIKPLPKSPAFRAGVRENDRILKINGVRTYGASLDELIEVMRGEPGTNVKISLLRDGEFQPAQIKLRREIIQVDSVFAEDLIFGKTKILRATIENFSSRTSKELLQAIKSFRFKHKGALDGLILDLRGNPGGLLDQAVQVADLFLEEGVIVATKGRFQEVERAGSGFDETGYPIVVLMNEDSASASEIVAGALQDHSRAVVLGQPSFGKGSVQTVFDLPDDRALKLTIARYYTPQDRSIQSVGIIPDIWLQPIRSDATNMNLLGGQRYRNERYLHRSLTQAQDSQVDPRLKTVTYGYYLTDPETRPAVDGDDFMNSRAKDYEVILAQTIIDEVKKSYSGKLPKGAQRASHWLALASPKLNQYLSPLTEKASSWLSRAHKVTWSDHRSSSFDVEIKVGEDPVHFVAQGDTLLIPFEVMNHGAVDANRVSAYLTTDIMQLATEEVLIGQVKAGGSAHGFFKVAIPSDLNLGPINLRLGVALSGWPVLQASTDFKAEILEKKRMSLMADATFEFQDRHTFPSFLEENARIKVHVKNTSEDPVHDLEISLQNLSGTQISLITYKKSIPILLPGAEKDFFFEIKPHKKVSTHDLAIGFIAESRDLDRVLQKEVRAIQKGKEPISVSDPQRVSH